MKTNSANLYPLKGQTYLQLFQAIAQGKQIFDPLTSGEHAPHEGWISLGPLIGWNSTQQLVGMSLGIMDHLRDLKALCTLDTAQELVAAVRWHKLARLTTDRLVVLDCRTHFPSFPLHTDYMTAGNEVYARKNENRLDYTFEDAFSLPHWSGQTVRQIMDIFRLAKHPSDVPVLTEEQVGELNALRKGDILSEVEEPEIIHLQELARALRIENVAHKQKTGENFSTWLRSHSGSEIMWHLARARWLTEAEVTADSLCRLFVEEAYPKVRGRNWFLHVDGKLYESASVPETDQNTEPQLLGILDLRFSGSDCAEKFN